MGDKVEPTQEWPWCGPGWPGVFLGPLAVLLLVQWGWPSDWILPTWPHSMERHQMRPQQIMEPSCVQTCWGSANSRIILWAPLVLQEHCQSDGREERNVIKSDDFTPSPLHHPTKTSVLRGPLRDFSPSKRNYSGTSLPQLLPTWAQTALHSQGSVDRSPYPLSQSSPGSCIAV